MCSSTETERYTKREPTYMSQLNFKVCLQDSLNAKPLLCDCSVIEMTMDIDTEVAEMLT